MDPDLFVFGTTDTQIAAAHTVTPGIETLAFKPSVNGTYTLNVCDVKQVGGAVRVIVTEE
jgi:hypothetical protein